MRNLPECFFYVLTPIIDFNVSVQLSLVCVIDFTYKVLGERSCQN